MPAKSAKTFRALLEPDGTRLRWTVARIPFDIKKAWPQRRGLRVRGTVNGFAFRTALFPDPRGAGHVLLVNKKMQAGAGARQGERVAIVLEPDLEERETLLPEELVRALKGVAGLRKWFDRMTPARRREIGKYVADPKSAASRMKRAEEMAERMALTMEGEVGSAADSARGVSAAAAGRGGLARADADATAESSAGDLLLPDGGSAGTADAGGDCGCACSVRQRPDVSGFPP